MKDLRRVEIYTLAHPITNEVRYVGKTVNGLKQRLIEHIKHKPKTYLHNWIKNLKKQNLEPKIELLETTDSNNWEESERYWIAQFKAWGFRLVNNCLGGQGAAGRKNSEESKLKCSATLKGRIISEETRQKISNSLKGKKVTSAERERLANLFKGRKHSEESLAKCRLINLGRKFSDEHKKKLSESRQRYLQNRKNHI